MPTYIRPAKVVVTEGGSGLGWLVLLAVCVAVAVGCYFATRAALAWVVHHPVDDTLMACPLAMAGFGVAWKAHERRARVAARPGAATPGRAPAIPAVQRRQP